MTLQQILYFKEIAKTQNFTQAAQSLFVAQSSLSHSIQCLEREVGVPLFVRKSGKKAMLTSYGQAFLPYADQILNNLEEGQKIIDRMRNPNSGVVTVTYSFVNCFSLVSMVFKDFYAEHSYNDISVRFEINQGRLLIEKNVAMGEQDLAFSCTPSYDGLNTLPIVQQELFLMLPVNHPLARKKKLSLFDVKDELFVGYYSSWNLSNWIVGMFESCGLQQNVMEYFPDWATQLTYVAMGIGLAITPRLPIDPKLIAMVPIDHPNRYRNVYLHWAANRKLSSSAEYVKQYCIDYFKERSLIL